MRADSGSLLATLAQSSAAIVAIVGGFLVSRLVALSSEREGLRRQLIKAREERDHVETSYKEAHEYRLENSKDDFFGWIVDDVVEQGTRLDREAALAENVPRGSSTEEMRPYLDELIVQAGDVEAHVREYIKAGDDTHLSLSDLETRGLSVIRGTRSLYEHMVDHIAESDLPRNASTLGGIVAPVLRSSQLQSGPALTTASRRLDESIRDEQQLRERKTLLDAEVHRLSRELEQIGRPVGVTSAVIILALYSLLGIVAPVVVMAFGPHEPSRVVQAGLVALFIVGLCAVLGYIFWYAKTLDDPIRESPDDKARS